ncbi:MAG: transcriptional regulator MntR [Ammonifex sp.]|jgi:Mn-dependent DtxR family transcriptional regulator|nr:MAG: transcriptional regulator MntR [Ammonifex sp.]
MSHTEKEFRTVRGYELLRQEDKVLTPSMEDYLEMACRLSRGKGYSRVGDLAAALNVQPPSASRMVQKLSGMGYVNYRKYGVVELTSRGQELGDYLLKRHDTIEQFLSIIGVTEGILEETEKIEHNISEGTLERIRVLVAFMQEHRQWIDAFNDYQKKLR